MSQAENKTETTSATPTPSEARIDRIGRWLTLAANIGVVVGLLVLVVEIRQNAALTRLSTEGEMNRLMSDIEMHLAAPEQSAAWVKTYTAPETMTDTEIRMNEAVLVSITMQWDYGFQMQRAGLRTPEEVERLIHNTAPFFFGSRFGKTWFAAQAAGWEGTEMMAVAGPIVAGLDENYMRDFYTNLRSGIQTPASPPAENVER